MQKDTECRFCGLTDHFAKCCDKAGKFPKGMKNSNSTQKEDSNSKDSKKSVHTLQIAQPIQENTTEFYDENGYLHIVHRTRPQYEEFYNSTQKSLCLVL